MLTQADKLARARGMREQVSTIDPDAPALLSELYPTVSATLMETEQVKFEKYTPEWEPDTYYKKCQTLMRNGQLYRECHGDYDMVHKGESRHYQDAEGPVYEAREDTAYSPDTYPQHWRKV